MEKRYALIIRLWRVKSKPIENDSELETAMQASPRPHWRGSLQLAGDAKVHYFDSLEAMNHLVEALATIES